MYAEQAKKQQGARIVVDYNSPTSAQYKAYERIFKNNRLIERSTDALNKKLALSRDITVSVKQCGSPEAFYRVKKDEIILCYEVVDPYIDEIQSASKVNISVAAGVAVRMTVFTLHHELAHALIDQLELPLAESAEDSADELGSILIFFSHDTRFAQTVNWSAAIQFLAFAVNSPRHRSNDVHSPDIQRSYAIRCLAFGASPGTAHPVLKKQITEANEQICFTKYHQAKTYWLNVLRPYLHKN